MGNYSTFNKHKILNTLSKTRKRYTIFFWYVKEV